MGNACGMHKKNGRPAKALGAVQDAAVEPTTHKAKGEVRTSIGAYWVPQRPTKPLLDILAKWNKMISLYSQEESPLESYCQDAKRSGKFIRRVKKGPPVQYRWTAWKSVVSLSRKVQRDEYWELPLGNYLTMAAIYRDLTRTFPGQPYFEGSGAGQAALQRMLGKLAGKYPELGYCQGMNFLGGLLLLVSGGEEVESFYMLECLLNEYRLKEFYSEDMPYLRKCIWVFNKLFKEKHTKLAEHFMANEILDEMWVFQWFMTMFSNVLGVEYLLRILDCFLIDHMLVVHQVAFALISICEKELLLLDTEGICNVLKNIQTALPDPQALLQEAIACSITYAKVKALERLYSKELSQQVQLRPEAPNTGPSKPHHETFNNNSSEVIYEDVSNVKINRNLELKNQSELPLIYWNRGKFSISIKEGLDHFSEDDEVLDAKAILKRLGNEDNNDLWTMIGSSRRGSLTYNKHPPKVSHFTNTLPL